MNSVTLVALIVVSIFLSVSVQGEDAQEFACKPGVPYEENECNRCSCSSTFNLVCSRKACPWNNTKGLKECTVGKKWEKECNNTCLCLENVGTLCTAHKCEGKD